MRRFRYFIIAAGALSAWLYWYASGNPPAAVEKQTADQKSRPATVVVQSHSGVSDHAGKPNPPDTTEPIESLPPPTPGQLARAVEYAPIERAFAIIERGIAAGVPGALDARAALQSRCFLVTLGVMADAHDPFVGSRGYYLRRIKEGCRGYDLQEPVSSKQMHSWDVASRLAILAESNGPKAAARKVEQILTASQNPYTLMGVGYALTLNVNFFEVVGPHLRITRGLFPSPSPRLQSAALQFAIEILRCRRADNCGPTSRKARDFCMVLAICEPGTTALEALGMYSPAITKNAARAIVKRLDGLKAGTWPDEQFKLAESSRNDRSTVTTTLAIDNDGAACTVVAEQVVRGRRQFEARLFDPAFEVGRQPPPSWVVSYANRFRTDRKIPICAEPAWYRRCFVAHARRLHADRGMTRPIKVIYPRGGSERFRLLGPILPHAPARYLIPVAGSLHCPGATAQPARTP